VLRRHISSSSSSSKLLHCHGEIIQLQVKEKVLAAVVGKVRAMAMAERGRGSINSTISTGKQQQFQCIYLSLRLGLGPQEI